MNTSKEEPIFRPDQDQREENKTIPNYQPIDAQKGLEAIEKHMKALKTRVVEQGVKDR